MKTARTVARLLKRRAIGESVASIAREEDEEEAVARKFERGKFFFVSFSGK